jgi:hypothetical protein
VVGFFGCGCQFWHVAEEAGWIVATSAPATSTEAAKVANDNREETGI